MAKHRQVVRKVENEAIDPALVNRVDTSFIAPYGNPIGAKVHKEHDVEGSDMGAIDHAMQWQNDRHSRAMGRHTAHPGEMRSGYAEPWNYQEAHAWADQLAALQAQKEHNAYLAQVEVKYGWLNKYFQPDADTHGDDTSFEELALGDDTEIISESETNQLGPIFTSTGRVIKSHKSHGEQMSCAPFGDMGLRKDISSYAYVEAKETEFFPVSVVIPAYVPRECWLEYCLKKIM